MSGHAVLSLLLHGLVCSASPFYVAEDSFVVASDDLMDVIHKAITQFDCILIDDFVEFVFSCGAHTEKTKEFLSFVCGNFFAIGRVKPNNFLLLALMSLLISFLLLILYVLGWAHVLLGALSGCFLASIEYIFIFDEIVYIIFVSGRRCKIFICIKKYFSIG